MTTQTRYFKNASIINNGLTCKDLGTSQTSSATYAQIQDVNTHDGSIGIRVWKRASDGTETELTSGTPVATITKAMSTSGIDSATWLAPHIEMLAGDSLVVRVYMKWIGGVWTLCDTWQTEDFGAGHLDEVSWTVYYWWYFNYDGANYNYRFYYGDSSHNSRIENYTTTLYSQMFGPAASLRIYKQGAAATPKSVSVTFTLKDLSDTPLVGKSIAFTASLGCSVSPSSADTDANGQASTTLTSGASFGWAVVKGAYAGDGGGGGESETYVEVAVYDEADFGDSSEPYQVFVQGIPKSFSGGNYRKSAAFDPQDFTIELSDVDNTIIAPLEVIIYRRGIKDFTGRMTKPVLTTSQSMTIAGKSNHWKLARRVANRTYTTTDPKDILIDILTRYPAGVSQGTINTFGTTITHEFKYETDLAVVVKLLDITGWKARLNFDDSLDFESDLGAVKAVSFANKSELGDLRREIDFGPLDTRTFLVGEPGTLVSDLDDATAEASYGLVEQAFFDKNATTQAVLDIENQAILDSRKVPIERISGPVVDLAYAANAYDVFDWVTVIDVAGTGLSGTYRVVAITRDMKDCGKAEIELSNLSLASEDLLARVARIVKDLSV